MMPNEPSIFEMMERQLGLKPELQGKAVEILAHAATPRESQSKTGLQWAKTIPGGLVG